MLASEDYTREEHFIQEPPTYRRGLHRIIGIVESGARKLLHISSVLIFECEEDGKKLWVANVLLLFRMYEGRAKSDEEFALIHYMEGILPSIKIENTLGCVPKMVYWGGEELYQGGQQV